MTKIKITQESDEDKFCVTTDEDFIVPNSDNQYIFSKHQITVDYNLKSLQTPQTVKAYAKRALKRVIHDDAEISAIKLKRPNFFAKIASRIMGRVPQARLYVTTKF